MIELELRRMADEQPQAILTWDEETGELTGSVADMVVRMAELAQRDGWVISHPYPTQYAIAVDPLRDRRALALVLSQMWVVPEALKDAYPDVEEGEEADVSFLF